MIQGGDENNEVTIQLPPSRIGEKIKDTFSFYLLIWFNISFLMMSISGLAAIIESKDSGWLHAIAVNRLYPSYVLCVSICWTTAGEFFKDSVSE